MAVAARTKVAELEKENFAALLDETLGKTGSLEGTVIKGRVISIENDSVLIDVGLKSEGRVDLKEFTAPGQSPGHQPDIKVGDTVEVFLERMEDKNGEAQLSREKARREEAWTLLEKSFQGNERVTDIAWRRINHPSEALHIGQTVKVQVIRFNSETQRISLGMKQLEADPWEGVELKYPANARFKGRVTNITDYGAFVELEPGVEGLVHVSEMSWTKKNVHPGKIVSTSQEVEVMLLDVNPQQRRISLGLEQTLANPW